VLIDPVHNQHRGAGALLGVLDLTPSRRDDVTFDGGQASASDLELPPVTKRQADERDGAASDNRNET
jgi:hypothetical protein